MDDDVATDILHATRRALCKHGYANLTLRDIAAETDTSKATIHYYYESKADLFTVFLEFLYEHYTERIESVSGDSPAERLRSLLDVHLTTADTDEDAEFRTAMLEVSAQAPYDDEVRTRLAMFDELLYDELRTIVANGIDEGAFDDRIDPDLIAEFLTAAINGAHTRHVATSASMDRFAEAIERYVETQLATGASEVAY